MAQLYAGFGYEDITPKLGTHLSGKSVTYKRPALSIKDRLYAKASAFQTGDTKVCFVGLDLTSITEDKVALIKDAVSKENAISTDVISVFVTQSHSAPGCGHFMLDKDLPLDLPDDKEFVRGSEKEYDEMAVKKIYDIKKRSLDKALSICLSDINEIPKVAKISKNNLDIISSLLPGPYTILLEKKDCISDTLTAHSNKIGIRIPNNKISRQLSQKFPITTTSANISNCKPEIRPDLIMGQLNCDVDLILDVGLLDNQEPSTIIDFTSSPPSLVRKGIGLNNLKNKINIIE